MRPAQRVRRCKCHKQVIHAPRDQDDQVTKRYCMSTRKVIAFDQTYLSTWGSEEEILIDQGPLVQRGCPVND